VKWVTENTPEAFTAAIDEKTKAIFVESIANPKYILCDIPVLAKVLYSLQEDTRSLISHP
jgi:O-acetylhomoserine/O-acetylserine sulfhydrylase